MWNGKWHFLSSSCLSSCILLVTDHSVRLRENGSCCLSQRFGMWVSPAFCSLDSCCLACPERLRSWNLLAQWLQKLCTVHLAWPILSSCSSCNLCPSPKVRRAGKHCPHPPPPPLPAAKESTANERTAFIIHRFKLYGSLLWRLKNGVNAPLCCYCHYYCCCYYFIYFLIIMNMMHSPVRTEPDLGNHGWRTGSLFSVHAYWSGGILQVALVSYHHKGCWKRKWHPLP